MSVPSFIPIPFANARHYGRCLTCEVGEHGACDGIRLFIDWSGMRCGSACRCVCNTPEAKLRRGQRLGAAPAQPGWLKP